MAVTVGEGPLPTGGAEDASTGAAGAAGAAGDRSVGLDAVEQTGRSGGWTVDRPSPARGREWRRWRPRRRARRVPAGVARHGTWLVGVPVLTAAAAVATVAGAAVGTLTVPAAAGLVGGGLVAAVWWRPVVASYALVAVTPLVVGIDRDRLIPLLRPNEALLGLLIAVLVARAVLHLGVGARPRLVLDPVTFSIVAMAVSSSFLPMLFMVLRHRPFEMDDITNAAVLWKYLAVFALVRCTVRTQRQVRVCLWLSMASAAVVGLLAIAQSLDLLGVRGLLIPYYAPFGYTAGFDDPRAGSTVGLPAAVADLMILNVCIAAGIWWRDRRFAWVLVPLTVVYVFATFSAAEFTSVLGLVLAVVTVAALLRRLDLLRYALVVLPLAVVVLWPTVENRLAGFSGTSAIPDSWIVRWYNLTTYFWPPLLSGANLFLGVRPSARVPVNGAFGFVWIESGYTWLFWGGGIFLAASYVLFTWRAMGMARRVARGLVSYSSIAGLAVYAGLLADAVLMIFDPHITYRGSADLLFILVGLALVETHLARGRPAADHPDHTTTYEGRRP